MNHDNRYRSDIPERAISHITRTHPNGAPAVAEFFHQGVLVGRRHWDPAGYLTLETPLRAGRKEGIEHSWYIEGKLTLAEPYKAGLVHGTARQWDDDGALLGTYTLVHGTGIDLWRARTAEGAIVLCEVFYLKNGRRDGFEWWINDDQVSVYEERHWQNGVQHGIERQWDLVGQLLSGFPRYFITGEAVSADAYQTWTAKDPTLPPYRLEDDRPGRNFPVEIMV